jgi:hypothetical protein
MLSVLCVSYRTFVKPEMFIKMIKFDLSFVPRGVILKTPGGQDGKIQKYTPQQIEHKASQRHFKDIQTFSDLTLLNISINYKYFHGCAVTCAQENVTSLIMIRF